MKGEAKEDINLCLSYDRLSVSYVMFYVLLNFEVVLKVLFENRIYMGREGENV